MTATRDTPTVAPVDGCGHVTAHLHGERRTYVAHYCRCTPCRSANRRYNARRNRELVYGQWTHRVDAAPAHAHLQMLAAAGIGRRRVAELAGIPPSTVTSLTNGRRGKPVRTVRRDIADRILAVRATVEAHSDNAIVPGRGAQRRVQALACLGWSATNVADRIGIRRSNFDRVVNGRPITAATHRAVAAVFDELWLAPAPRRTPYQRNVAARMQNAASRNGWVPPLGWDDIDLDDTPATTADVDDAGFDEIAVELLMTGRHDGTPPRCDRLEAARRLHTANVSVTEIARRLRVSGATAAHLVRQAAADPTVELAS